MDKARAKVKELQGKLRDRSEAEQASRKDTDRLLHDLRDHLRSDCMTAKGWLQQELKAQVSLVLMESIWVLAFLLSTGTRAGRMAVHLHKAGLIKGSDCQLKYKSDGLQSLYIAARG